MGKEIRRVPPNWEHPQDPKGHFIPLFDRLYEDDLELWQQNNQLWATGQHPDQLQYPEATATCTYSDWAGKEPDPTRYRPPFQVKPSSYQIYETITEGTPVSPVFETTQQLADHLISTGQATIHEAQAFVQTGSLPTFVLDIVSGTSLSSYRTAPYA